MENLKSIIKIAELHEKLYKPIFINDISDILLQYFEKRDEYGYVIAVDKNIYGTYALALQIYQITKFKCLDDLYNALSINVNRSNISAELLFIGYSIPAINSLIHKIDTIKNLPEDLIKLCLDFKSDYTNNPNILKYYKTILPVLISLESKLENYSVINSQCMLTKVIKPSKIKQLAQIFNFLLESTIPYKEDMIKNDAKWVYENIINEISGNLFDIAIDFMLQQEYGTISVQFKTENFSTKAYTQGGSEIDINEFFDNRKKYIENIFNEFKEIIKQWKIDNKIPDYNINISETVEYNLNYLDY